jgi:hypothetical protein
MAGYSGKPLVQRRVTDVQFFEGEGRAGGDGRKRSQISGIGQLVEDDHFMAEVLDKVTAYRRTDKAGRRL